MKSLRCKKSILSIAIAIATALFLCCEVEYGIAMPIPDSPPPPISDWAFPGEEIIIAVEGYDPNDINCSFDFPVDPEGPRFIYNTAENVYEFRWQTSEQGVYSVIFHIKDTEKEANFAVVNPSEIIIYIDNNAFWLTDRVPAEGSFGGKYTGNYIGRCASYDYQERCSVIDLDGYLDHSFSDDEIILDGYIRNENPSFIPSRDLSSRINSLAIPIDTPGAFSLAIPRTIGWDESWSNWRTEIFWLDVVSENRYSAKAKMNATVFARHGFLDYYFLSDDLPDIELGDISLKDINRVTAGIEYGSELDFRGIGICYRSSATPDYSLTESSGYFTFYDTPISFTLYGRSDGKRTADYFNDSGGLMITSETTTDGETTVTFITPPNKTFTVGVPDNFEITGLTRPLETIISCHQVVEEVRGDTKYFSESGEILFHENRDDGVLASYAFGDSVILPHLDENSFVVQLQSKRFDFPVKFVDFRHTQNDWIEYYNLKPDIEPQAGQKSLRIYRKVNPGEVKYEYIEYLTPEEKMGFGWDEEGNLIDSPGSPPVAEDFVVETEVNAPLEINLSGHVSDPDEGDTLAYAVGKPRHGTVNSGSSAITYTPHRDYAGVDSFAYTATDSVGLRDSGKVTVLVIGNGFDPIPKIGKIRNTDSSRVSVDADENVIYIEEVEYGNAINSDAEYYPGSLRFHIVGGVFEEPPKHEENPNPPEIKISAIGAEQITAYGGMELQYDGTYEPYGVIEWVPSESREVTVEVIDNQEHVSANKLILRINVVNVPPKTIRVPQDYTSIEDAVGHANPGDTIAISAGSYEFGYEDLILPFGVNLIGEGTGVTEIRGLYPDVVGGGNACAAAVVVGSNSIIKGLTLHSNVILQGVTNVVIEECISDAQPIGYHPGTFYGNWFNAAGITIDSTSFSNTISNNLMYGNPSIAVLGNNNEIRNNILVQYNNPIPWDEGGASNLVIGGSNNKVVNNTCVMYLTEMTRNFVAEWVHNISIAAIEGHFVGSGNDVRNNIFRMYDKGEMEFMSIGLSNGVYQEPKGEVLFDYNFISDPSSGPIPGTVFGANNITTGADPLFVKDIFDAWDGFETLLSLDFHLKTGSPCIDAGDPQPEYNDPDGTRNDMGAYGGPDSFGIIRVPEDIPSIQKAIDHASAGDTILAAVGTYEEGKYSEDRCGTIVMKEGVDLIGRDKWTTSIEAEPLEAGGIYAGLHTLYSVRGANNCKLQGFTLEGVLLDNVDNMVITDNIINGALLYHRSMRVGVKSGLTVQNGSSGNTISNNIITGRPPIHLRFMSDGEPIYPSNNKIYNNVLIAGIGASDLSLSGYGNEIVNNVFYINGDFGGVTNAANITITACNSSNIIKNNIFYIKHETNPTLAEKKSISLEGEVAGGTITVDYNFIPYSVDEGITLGEGNITDIEDPGFIDLETFHLQIGSPCINAGDPQPEYNDPAGTRNDMGAYGGPQGAWASSTGGGE